VLDVATGQERRISSDGAGWWPAWSPDATRLAWLTNSTPGDIGIAAADGSAGVTYIESTGIGRPPAWSPDGREIYGLDDAGTTTIVITVDGSAPVARIRHAPSQALPDWQRVSP